VLLLPLINGIKPQVGAGKIIIHVLIEVGSVEARGACPSVALSQKGSVLLLLKGNNTRTTRKIINTLTTRTNPTRIRIATTTTFPTNFPTISWGRLIIRHSLNIIIKNPIGEVRDRGRNGVGERKKGKPVMTGMDLTSVHDEHLHQNTRGQIKLPP